jgi:hypothetical protein
MTGGKIKRECRTFDTSTSGHKTLLGWLTESECAPVAIEATGVSVERNLSGRSVACIGEEVGM